MMPPLFPVIAITGIDTNIGKTVVTGLLGRFLQEQGRRVITQKVAQTGCSGFSEDIATHRQLMGLSLQAEDQQGLTCPYTFPLPCSPHLAADLAGRQIDPHIIQQATRALTSRYEMVLLEGAGGLLVPLTDDLLFLDYLEQECLPLIVVSSPRLGSLNHTLAALELARNRGLTVLGIAYNRYQEENPVIANDSARIFLRFLHRYGHHPCVLDIFAAQDYLQHRRPLDFSPFFSIFSQKT